MTGRAGRDRRQERAAGPDTIEARSKRERTIAPAVTAKLIAGVSTFGYAKVGSSLTSNGDAVP